MSGKMHFDAKISGYGYPIFPREICRLNRVYDSSDMTGRFFDHIGRSVPGYLGKGSPTSSDGYFWFWALKFLLPSGSRVLFAFPWSQDWNRSNQLELDRSVAIYTSGNVTTAEVDDLVEQVLNAFATESI